MPGHTIREYWRKSIVSIKSNEMTESNNEMTESNNEMIEQFIASHRIKTKDFVRKWIGVLSALLWVSIMDIDIPRIMINIALVLFYICLYPVCYVHYMITGAPGFIEMTQEGMDEIETNYNCSFEEYRIQQHIHSD